MVEPTDRDTRHRRHVLAAQVRDRLAEAGLPVTADLHTAYTVGAEVHIDPSDDELGGVYVAWHAHPALAGRVQEMVMTGTTDAPTLRRAVVVGEAMLAALERILTGTGFTVQPTRNDMAPNQLHVLSGPATGRA